MSSSAAEVYRVRFDGLTARLVYTDAAAGLMAKGTTTTTRASHVEPWRGGGWYADMRPSGGPVLFANGGTSLLYVSKWHAARWQGFATRQAALDAERAWLRQYRGV